MMMRSRIVLDLFEVRILEYSRTLLFSKICDGDDEIESSETVVERDNSRKNFISNLELIQHT